MAHVLLVNCTGPDGREYRAGDTVPAKWGKKYIDSLVASGGAKAERTTTRSRKAAK